MSLIYDPDARAIALRGVIEEKYLMIQNWILIPCNISYLKIIFAKLELQKSRITTS